MSEAKVSIVLPAYNAEMYLGKAISSILNQTYRHLELIVINDGSKDQTEEIIQRFKDERLIYIKNEKNLGLIETLNKGFQLATGDFIARMDADDIAHPDRLKTQVDFLQSLNHPAIVGSNIIIIDNNDDIVKIPRKVHQKKEENFWIKFRKTPLQHPTVMMSREIALAFSPFYQKSDVHMEDYAAWLRVNDRYPIYNLGEPLLFYRMHDFNITKVHNQTQTQNMISFLKNYYKTTLGDHSSHEYLINLIFLKMDKKDDSQKVFKEIFHNAQIFIKKFGKEDIVLCDVAYSILNIGMKSGAKNFLSSLAFVLTHLSFTSLTKALFQIANEVLRSQILKFYYQIKYNRYLKEKV